MSRGARFQTAEACDALKPPAAAFTPSSSKKEHRSPGIPREIYILPNNAPYAQLCFPRDDDADQYCLMLLGRNNNSRRNVTSGLNRRHDKPLHAERHHKEGNEDASPEVKQNSSSVSFEARGNSGPAAHVVARKRQQCDSLRIDTMGIVADDSFNTKKPLHGSSRQSIQWPQEFHDSYKDEPYAHPDAWSLLGNTSTKDSSNDNTAEASGCGHFLRGIGFFRGGPATSKPYHKALRRRQAPPSPPQPVAPNHNEYSALP